MTEIAQYIKDRLYVALYAIRNAVKWRTMGSSGRCSTPGSWPGPARSILAAASKTRPLAEDAVDRTNTTGALGNDDAQGVHRVGDGSSRGAGRVRSKRGTGNHSQKTQNWTPLAQPGLRPFVPTAHGIFLTRGRQLRRQLPGEPVQTLRPPTAAQAPERPFLECRWRSPVSSVRSPGVVTGYRARRECLSCLDWELSDRSTVQMHCRPRL